MSNINTNSRSSFFPNSKTARANQAAQKQYQQPSRAEAQEGKRPSLKRSSSVKIPEGLKDFSRIKELAVNAPNIDRKEQVQTLKNKVNSGSYHIDYDRLADQMLLQELA